LFGLHARNHFSFERLTAVSLNVQNFAAIANFSKGDGQAIATSTARTANAVSVVFGFHGQAKVEHVRDGGHVNAAGCHVSGDQDLNLAVAQSHQAAIAQALAQSAVQSNGIKTILLQVCG
jgi:nanoRNase/pAp phosphatase (c-di-AMP/oligoRNAs hydrolase)